MRTTLPISGRHTFYSIPDAAWILGITPDQAAQAVRRGRLRTVRRRGRLVVPADALAAILGGVR